MALDLLPDEVKAFQEALLGAFERDELRQVVYTDLGKDLDDFIRTNEPYESQVFDLVRWASRQGRVAKLLQRVRKANPENRRLQSFEVQLLSRASLTEADPRGAFLGKAGLLLASDPAIELGDREQLRRRIEDRLSQRMRYVDQLVSLKPNADRGLLVRAFRAFKPPPASVPDVADDALFENLVEELAYSLPHDGVQPLVGFVATLVHALKAASKDCAALESWVSAAGPAWGINAAALAAQAAEATASVQQALRSEPGLMISLEPDDDPDRRDRLRIRAWVWLGPDHVERVAKQLTDSYTLDEASERVRDIYDEALRYIARDSTRLTVEFFLPRVLLSTPVQQWKVLIGVDEDQASPLALEHRVVVRPQERNFSPNPRVESVRTKWRDRWKKRSETDSDGFIYKPDCPDVFTGDTGLRLKLMAGDFVGYAETIPVPNGVDHAKCVLKAVIDAGLSVGIWLPAAKNPDAAVYAKLDELADPRAVPTWRDEVARRRKQAIAEPASKDPAICLGAGVILLWDDPDRAPPAEEMLRSPAAT